ncbi:Heat shock protein STI1 [Clavispora lusitaniae]|uniref:Hsp90 cochaperone n=1 Tax=Clavispora lusitaniae TaxID=36911 RepID=A0AA91PVN2_CLALS|nr:Heat shock protein STI1 [Clavispora lusitaniae]OVF05487.1 putative hsp90 cochaperone [Clavispora lusitaniae]
MSAEEYKAQGNKHFAAKEFDQAIEQFTKAIEASSSPNHVLYSNRSACYASLKNFTKALEDAEKCVEINNSWAKGYNRVGAAQYGLGNFEDAKKAYSTALELDASNAMAQSGLKAVEDAENARNAQPDLGLGKMFSDPNLITNLKNNPKTAELMKDPNLVAKLLQIQANPQAGMSTMLSDPRMMTIMAALMGIDFDMPTDEKTQESSADSSKPEPKAEPKPETKPEPKAEQKEEAKDAEDVEMEDSSKVEAEAAKAQGNTLYKQRKFDEAIEQYNKAWELHKDITFLNNRAAAEFEKGDYDAAIATCELAVEEGRSLRADYKLIAKSFARLGNCFLKKDDLESAAKYFDKSLTEHRTPDVLAKLRSTQKEIKVREAASYIDPEKAEEARLLGKEYFTKGDWPNAVKAYTEMVKRAPDDARGYSNRAAALAKLMSFPDAVEDCNKAIAKDPTFIRAYIRKANAQLAMKEYSHVIETLTEAREKDQELNGGKNVAEIDQLYNKAASQRFSAIEGETPEQTMERVSRDPEIVSILQDPVMQGILGQARENPAALQDHMRNPAVSKKINTLIAAGVIRTR